MMRVAIYSITVTVLLRAWLTACSFVSDRRLDMDFAYVIGSSVRLTRHGALVICNGKADYIAVAHGPGAGEFVRRYVEAACQ